MASEMVGARGIVLEATNDKLEGIKGIITSVSGSCYYLLVDTLPDGAGVTGRAEYDPNQPHNIGRPRLGHILRLVKEHCNLGIVLPAISRVAVAASSSDNKGSNVSSSSGGQPVKTPVKSGTNSELNIDTTLSDNDSEDKDDGESDASDDISVQSGGDAAMAGSATETKVDYSHKVFDWNERSEGAKLCVLYGKSFMPCCTYEEKQ